MAGSPMKRAMISELSRRANLAGCSAIELVCEWVAEGQTLIAIAKNLSKTAGVPISPGVLGKWVSSTPAGKDAIAKARGEGAYAMVEQATEILEETRPDRDHIALSKAKVDLRLWQAARFNRAQFGGDAAQVQVNLNLGQIHLDALRARAVPVTVKAEPVQPQLDSGEPDVELVPSTGTEPIDP